MGNVPPKPAVELLFFQGVSVQTLVNYGPFRYHLLVERNYDEGGCQENALLEKVDDALGASDDAAVDDAREACMALAYPLMFDDYRARISSNQKPKGTIKLRATGLYVPRSTIAILSILLRNLSKTNILVSRRCHPKSQSRQ